LNTVLVETKKLARVATLVVCVCGVLVGFFSIFVYLQPILISSTNDNAEVWIDGQQFIEGRQTRYFYAWKPAYDVKIKVDGEITLRQIYPWDSESDSGSIIITSDGPEVSLATAPLK